MMAKFAYRKLHAYRKREKKYLQVNCLSAKLTLDTYTNLNFLNACPNLNSHVAGCPNTSVMHYSNGCNTA